MGISVKTLMDLGAGAHVEAEVFLWIKALVRSQLIFTLYFEASNFMVLFSINLQEAYLYSKNCRVNCLDKPGFCLDF